MWANACKQVPTAWTARNLAAPVPSCTRQFAARTGKHTAMPARQSVQECRWKALGLAQTAASLAQSAGPAARTQLLLATATPLSRRCVVTMGRHTPMSVWPAVLAPRSPARVLANQHKPSSQVSHSRLGCIGAAGRVGYCTAREAMSLTESLSQAVGTGYLHACMRMSQYNRDGQTRRFHLLFLLIEIPV